MYQSDKQIKLERYGLAKNDCLVKDILPYLQFLRVEYCSDTLEGSVNFKEKFNSR